MHMKRRIIAKLLAFVLAGAIINVAVAWYALNRGVLPLRLPPNFGWQASSDEGIRQLWSRYAQSDWPAAPATYNSYIGPMLRARIVIESPGFWVEQNDYGFPFVSLRQERWSAPSRGFLKQGNLGFSFAGVRVAAEILPTGFAINTIFYGGILWMLFALPFAIRRRRRLKRGLCPVCAYPIGGSPTCTECGAAVPNMKKI
jgi:hypothetical protein